MILKKFYLGFLALFILFSYPMQIPNQSSASSAEGGSSTGKQNPFTVKLSLPQKVKVNEEFSIEASLKKETLSNLQISSRTRLFTYVIKDESGTQINAYAVTDGGIARILSGKSNISEGYTYKIKKSGTYYVSAVAEFSIMDNGNSKDVKIKTESKKLEVK
ncbi:hypothetical protein [Paenibacillus riograndensis]|uniref:Uncharacterized protein n=2 Tax=Paenibacillus riograndensis TaxID=483937 RepID=A0A0E4H928_9BACL|nr:hypothetical protein [Paenibacillus riograndensis]CQR54279.1 hypothetical protein PRIO_1869 [Paenibacillus riograndensis SBR5]